MIQTLLTPLQELRTVLSAPGILGALWLTAQTCLIAGIGFAIFGPMLAWWFARRPTAFSRIASFLTTLPLVFPPVALGYLLLVLLGRNGWIGSWLYDAGIYLIFTPASVALAAFIAGLPLVVKPIQTALEGRQLKAIEFAGAVHGASGWTILTHHASLRPTANSLRTATGRFTRKRRSRHHHDGGRQPVGQNQHTLVGNLQRGFARRFRCRCRSVPDPLGLYDRDLCDLGRHQTPNAH